MARPRRPARRRRARAGRRPGAPDRARPAVAGPGAAHGVRGRGRGPRRLARKGAGASRRRGGRGAGAGGRRSAVRVEPVPSTPAAPRRGRRRSTLVAANRGGSLRAVRPAPGRPEAPAAGLGAARRRGARVPRRPAGRPRRGGRAGTARTEGAGAAPGRPAARDAGGAPRSAYADRRLPGAGRAELRDGRDRLGRGTLGAVGGVALRRGSAAAGRRVAPCLARRARPPGGGARRAP